MFRLQRTAVTFAVSCNRQTASAAWQRSSSLTHCQFGIATSWHLVQKDNANQSEFGGGESQLQGDYAMTCLTRRPKKNALCLRSCWVHLTSVWLKGLFPSLHYFMYAMSKTEAEWKEETMLCLSESNRTLDKALSQPCSLLSGTLIRPLEITFPVHLWSRSAWPSVCARLSFLLVTSTRLLTLGLQALETLWQLWAIWFICRWPTNVTVRHFQLQKLEQSLVRKTFSGIWQDWPSADTQCRLEN